ncbi:MAG: hydrogen gas-evolving membrane-bound hydrogenase subunit E [Alkalilacustris sp.]
MDPMVIFDAALALALVALSWAVLSSADRFAAVVLFIVLGLMVALAWVRLGAPDVALAEAAIGAGVTGALLLATLRHLRGQPEAAPSPAPVRWAVGAMVGAVTTALAAVVVTLTTAPRPEGLAGAVAENLAASGVEHTVTAVLLNFRAHDTLMEVVVLLVAVVVVWAIDRGLAPAHAPQGPLVDLGPVQEGFARLALPAAVLLGAYLLWAGAHAPGGAFQGGAVLAAVGILAILAGRWRPEPRHRAWARASFGLGAGVFVLIALGVGVGPRVAYEYPLTLAKPLILTIEAAVTLSIAATLAALFFGREPAALGALGSGSRTVREGRA